MHHNQEVANEETGSGVHNCVACGRKGRIGFYSIPTDPDTRADWLQRCGLDRKSPIAPTARMCKLHFKKEDFSVRYQKRYLLKKEALPSIVVDAEKSSYQQCHRNKSCFICGSLNKENHSFHRIPFDCKTRKEWFENLGIIMSDFESLSKKDIRLCEIHFSKADFIIHPQTKSRRLKRGSKPIIAVLGKQQETLAHDNNEDSDSSVEFVSSYSRNSMIHLDSDEEEDVPVPVIESTSDEIAPNQSNGSSSKKKNNAVTISIDLTEEVEYSDYEIIRQLKKKRKLLKRTRKNYENLFENLVKNKGLTKNGKKRIKKFRKNLENPTE